MKKGPFKMKGLGKVMGGIMTGSASLLKKKTTEGGKLLDEVEVSGGKAGKSRAQREYDKMIESKAAEEMSRGRYAGDNYKEAYANLPEENKIKYRAQAQKRIKKSKK
tara:strand:+ start:328 stop:648 length:321 start_codon:yes stop_codon:yes gene_type:complete